MKTIIAVDAMGGDDAPRCVIEGISIAVRHHREVKFLLFGKENEIKPLLEEFHIPDANYEIHHCDEYITGDMKPTAALRHSKNSSMRKAIEAVQSGQANGVVSAGNTGAYMALAKIILKTLEGIDRPAIAGVMPTAEGSSIMLDMGANVDCSSENLVQFAMMGEVFGKAVLHKNTPSVGLLNIGAEVLKGNDAVKEAYNILDEQGLVTNFQGFVEGDDVLMGKTDIVVTDGFSGNVALKTAEGSAKLLTILFKREMKQSILARIGVFLALGALKKLKAYVDPRKHNGAILLGLNGIVVKSHGGTDGFGFSSAINVAYELITNNAVSQIQNGLDSLKEKSA